MNDRAISPELSVRTVGTRRDHLGEGPVWDGERGRLRRVDINRGLVITCSDTGADELVWNVGGEVSAAVSRAGGGLVLAIGHDLVAYAADGTRRTLAIVEDRYPGNRFNDCRCDPQGRLWAGTMSKTRVRGVAGLYRLDPDAAITCVIPGTTLSNGLGWSPDGTLMYFIDSTEQRVDVCDFDPADGSLHDRRPFAYIPVAAGLPDGLAVDVEGGVWVCLFGGGAIHRYDADGDRDLVVPLPVTNPTCPAFGGADRTTLFVTSAKHKLSPERLAGEPLAGALLAVDVGVAGLPAMPFAG